MSLGVLVRLSLLALALLPHRCLAKSPATSAAAAPAAADDDDVGGASTTPFDAMMMPGATAPPKTTTKGHQATTSAEEVQASPKTITSTVRKTTSTVPPATATAASTGPPTTTTTAARTTTTTTAVVILKTSTVTTTTAAVLPKTSTVSTTESVATTTSAATSNCPAVCTHSCAACDAMCDGCRFCSPVLPGPFGTFSCGQTYSVQLEAGDLRWSLGPAASGAGAGCQTLCFEVWASSLSDFGTYAPVTISGVPAWSLLDIPATFQYFKVRAIVEASQQAEVSRTSWSNVLVRAPTTTPMSTISTTQTSRFSTSTTGTPTTTGTWTTSSGTAAPTFAGFLAGTTTTTSTWTTPPPGTPTTFVPLWIVPSSNVSAAPTSIGPAQGIEASLLFQVPPMAVSSFASGTTTPRIEAALAAMLGVEQQRISILMISAAEVKSKNEVGPFRRLDGPAQSGAMRVRYVVVCASKQERQQAAAAVEFAAIDPSARQRFAQALTAQGGGGLSVLDVGGLAMAVVDRDWSAGGLGRTAMPGAMADGSDGSASPKEGSADSGGVGDPGALNDSEAAEVDSFLLKTWPFFVAMLFIPFACLGATACGPILEHLGISKGESVRTSRKRPGGVSTSGSSHERRTLLAQGSPNGSSSTPGGSSISSTMGSGGAPPEVGKAPAGVGFNPRKFDPLQYMATGGSPDKALSVSGTSEADTRPLLPKRGGPAPLSRSGSHRSVASSLPGYARSSPAGSAQLRPGSAHSSAAAGSAQLLPSSAQVPVATAQFGDTAHGTGSWAASAQHMASGASHNAAAALSSGAVHFGQDLHAWQTSAQQWAPAASQGIAATVHNVHAPAVLTGGHGVGHGMR
mmetsp:Transcript_64578/g.209611  ORF Transcript_64578/g.209611 Transcript_64578/m.209611 type:complete len:854 (+) Transcript_64578:147-2708(+)